ncbi:NinB family protein [Devosia epidermidihirudinis]|uniref:NinB family protein n=1 Tax=Devosia epidermidihirudinis TaxID=1293439 RepID=A0A0F5QF03_9HYPH|nr:recombination protein NinB [Devosia epidermidihirudinis]KKC39552.1 NinB family protein [Devosia epidermidihirudinis]
MSRATVILNGKADREKVCRWAMGVPAGTRVEFKEVKRTLPQNDRMWAMLTDLSQQATLGGKQFAPDQWKVIFLHALGQEIQLLPSLDGRTFVPWGQSSSDLTKDEMTGLIELMFKFGAEHGVQFQDDRVAA